MKAKCNRISKVVTVGFEVEHESQTYDVTVQLNEKGKFDDVMVTRNGDPLEGEGTDGVIVEAITDYLDEHWDRFVPKE